jgi:hypothetical protein
MYERTNKTVVDVSPFPLFRKIWPVVVIASMLSLHLASVVEKSAVTPFESARFEISALVLDGGSTEDCLLKTEPELSFNVDLVPAEEVRFPGDRLQALAKPPPAVLSLKEIISEIFIPPRSVS